MALNLSRRHWMALASLGMSGLLASERKAVAQPSSRALADPRSAIKITKLTTSDRTGRLMNRSVKPFTGIRNRREWDSAAVWERDRC